MSTLSKTWLGIVFIALLIVVVIASLSPYAIEIKTDSEVTIFSILGSLFVLVLLIERTVEIFISIWREGNRKEKETQVAAFRAKVQAVDRQNTAMLDEANNGLATAEKDLIQHQAGTQKRAFWLSYALGVLVCAAGVGVFNSILAVDFTGEVSGHEKLLRGMDIILTAGLLGGGSDAFHQFVTAITTFFQKTKEKLKEEATQQGS